MSITPSTLFTYPTEDIARSCERHAGEIRLQMTNAIYGIAEIGRTLLVVKDLLDSLFQDWLDFHFGWSIQTARNYIRLSEIVDDNPKVLGLKHLTLIYRLPRLPEEVQAAIIELQPKTLSDANEIIYGYRKDRWKEDIEQCVEEDPGLALRRIEWAMDDPIMRDTAIETMDKYVEVFAAHSDRDPWEIKAEAGMSREERLPAQRPVGLRFYEGEDNHSVVAWADGKAHTLLVFPRIKNPLARAWQNAIIESICSTFEVKDEVL